mmetsp:Transcript_8095/g.13068  ORF Transcript_8095/g.13068 Transcript_8095/m.13068 type:complete len:574 (+) Transcript_8095:306-2027(+)
MLVEHRAASAPPGGPFSYGHIQTTPSPMFDLRLQDLAHLKTDTALVSWVLRPVLRQVRERFSELTGSEVENLIAVLNDLKVAFLADPTEALASGFLDDLLALFSNPLLKRTSSIEGGIYSRLSKALYEVIGTLTAGKTAKVASEGIGSLWPSGDTTWRAPQSVSVPPINPPVSSRVSNSTRSWTWGGSTSLSPFLSDPTFASIYLAPLDVTNPLSAPSTPAPSKSAPLPSLSRAQTPFSLDHILSDDILGLPVDIDKLLLDTPDHHSKQSRYMGSSVPLNLHSTQLLQRVLPPQAVLDSSRRGSGSDVAESSFASLTTPSTSSSSNVPSPHTTQTPPAQYGPYDVLIRILEENRAKHGSLELEMAPLGMRMGTLVPDWRERFKVRHLKEFVLRAYEAGVISMRHVGTQQTFIAPKAWMQQQPLGTTSNPDELSMLSEPERNTPSPPTTAIFGDKRVVGSVVHVREHFGFIRCKCMEADVFFHRRDLADPLQGMPSVGDLLEFSLVKNKRTKQVSAVRVAKLETDEVPVSPSGSSEEIAATNFSFEPLSPTVSSTLSEDAMIGFSRTSSSSIAN